MWEKGQKNLFRRLWRGKIQVFQAPTGYSTADKAFIAVLCDNVWEFWAKKPKKKKILEGFGRGKIQAFQAPTGYSTADKAFIAVLFDNIWTF